MAGRQLRGLEKVNMEWEIACPGYNLKRYTGSHKDERGAEDKAKRNNRLMR
jgi:hypothetical protein